MSKSLLCRLFIAWLVCAATACVLVSTVFWNSGLIKPPDHQPLVLVMLIVATALGMLVLFVLIGLASYVFKDARRRGMPPLVWALISFFVPYFLGFIIYILVRSPLRAVCPACGASAPMAVVHCPQCGHALKGKCASCGAVTEKENRFCPSCGKPLAG